MNIAESFRDKVFVVINSDARIRRTNDLMSFLLDPGGHFQTIPIETKVKIVDIRLAEVSSRNSIIFGHATSADGTQDFGWTSTRNLDGKFIGETVGTIQPKPGASRFGPNAAWSRGLYLGQLELVSIVDSKLELERIAIKTVEPFIALVASAKIDGVPLTLNSGFRSYSEQKYLYDGFVRGSPGFNKAAKPGFSNHQNGIAFDISIPGGDGNPIYEWLKRNAPRFGFVRTVNMEPWHWEFDEPKAQVALASGTFKVPTVMS